MMTRISITLAVAVLFAVSAYGQTGTKDAKPCEAIKGKTFVVWTVGKFDANPDAASAARIEFDAAGKGTVRSFIAYRPTDAMGTQQMQTVECATLAVAISGRSYLKGKSYLAFKNSDGGDAGQAFITSYDGGFRVWVEAASPGRPMKGWMIALPPNPPVNDNLIK